MRVKGLLKQPTSRMYPFMNRKPRHIPLPGKTVTQPETRICDYPGCTAHGVYRAPKSPERLRDYYWFCLTHVRDYNRRWNYCTDLSIEQINSLYDYDLSWGRQTSPFSNPSLDVESVRQAIHHAFAEDGRIDWRFSTRSQRSSTDMREAPELAAMAELNLEPPAPFATIRASYKALVKRHHPDANQGSLESEEKIKRINHAYSILKHAYNRDNRA
ncbi:MAG: DnaJ domain-containing protein [Pseudomonadota bacterium]|nr:DnaJ domain-containing protein [Pseudomonadota bacterium]